MFPGEAFVGPTKDKGSNETDADLLRNASNYLHIVGPHGLLLSQTDYVQMTKGGRRASC